MSPALTNFLFEVLNFLLLAAGLGWVLFKPVRQALDTEQARQQKQDAERERLLREATELREQARLARERDEQAAAESRAARLAAVEREAAALLERARQAQADARRAFEAELAARRDAEASALADDVGRLASDSVVALLGQLNGPSLDAALTRAASNQLRSLSSEARAAALVESARPLDAESQRLLEAALGPGFRQRTVAALGAGVRITTSVGQVDASAAALARRAQEALRATGAALTGAPGA